MSLPSDNLCIQGALKEREDSGGEELCTMGVSDSNLAAPLEYLLADLDGAIR